MIRMCIQIFDRRKLNINTPKFLQYQSIRIQKKFYLLKIFSYFYFETAPHTFLFDVIAISAFNFWIVIVMKHVGTFVVQKYAKRSDLIHVVYTFTHITSNVFYRNYILAKSLTEISVVAVINISGLLSLLKILIWCSKRYFFFVHPDLARNDSVNNLALIASNQVHSVSNYYEKAVAHHYQIHIRSIALEYGETVRTQLITMLSFVCWTFMIRSGPNSKFYPVFSESNISNESLGVAMQISVAIVGFECITNIAIWTLVKRIYKINLWREYIFNMADDPLIIRINFLIGIHVLGDMLLAVVAPKFKP
ncbi:hypothetical protein BKA69DRAFT_368863 [Paraphysoderma sedebokerense]|nr:hypothetical protein BKA69DRAFT_368863 [Paraphysoderma sedebokerense]